MLKLCHEVGSSVPVFVARDLSSLPAVSANSFDVAPLMRDIEAMESGFRNQENFIGPNDQQH